MTLLSSSWGIKSAMSWSGVGVNHGFGCGVVGSLVAGLVSGIGSSSCDGGGGGKNGKDIASFHALDCGGMEDC